MYRYNSQRLLYAQINKSSNGLQEGWGKARISADNIAIVYQGFPPEQSTLLNRTTFRRRRPPKIKCISDVIESYRVLRHRVGGWGVEHFIWTQLLFHCLSGHDALWQRCILSNSCEKEHCAIIIKFTGVSGKRENRCASWVGGWAGPSL